LRPHAAGARRELARCLDNALADDFRRLSTDQRGAIDVEIGNAVNTSLQSHALQSADALYAIVGAEECRDCIPIETRLAGDFSQNVRGPDIAPVDEICS
jgi:hypothetical protein